MVYVFSVQTGNPSVYQVFWCAIFVVCFFVTAVSMVIVIYKFSTYDKRRRAQIVETRDDRERFNYWVTLILAREITQYVLTLIGVAKVFPWMEPVVFIKMPSILLLICYKLAVMRYNDTINKLPKSSMFRI